MNKNKNTNMLFDKIACLIIGCIMGVMFFALLPHNMMVTHEGDYVVSEVKCISKSSSPHYQVTLKNCVDTNDPTRVFNCRYYTDTEYTVGDTVTF